jgi:threonine dehydratase
MRLNMQRIHEAYERIDPVFRDTPSVSFPALNAITGADISLKLECLNPIRSFKGRGVVTMLSRLHESQPDVRQVVCASAGNLGQALAWCSRQFHVSASIVVPETVSPIKLEAIRRLGGNVLIHGGDFDAAKVYAHDWAQANQAYLVIDSLDLGSCDGAATIALEETHSGNTYDTVLVALGNGALATGVGTVFKYAAPATQAVAVQSKAASAMTQSWQERRIVETATAATIADGIAVRVPIPEVVADTWEVLDDAIAVDESSIRRAMKIIAESTGLLCEPSAAVGVAAILENPQRFRGQRVLCIICGTNITVSHFNDLVGAT